MVEQVEGAGLRTNAQYSLEALARAKHVYRQDHVTSSVLVKKDLEDYRKRIVEHAITKKAEIVLRRLDTARSELFKGFNAWRCGVASECRMEWLREHRTMVLYVLLKRVLIVVARHLLVFAVRRWRDMARLRRLVAAHQTRALKMVLTIVVKRIAARMRWAMNTWKVHGKTHLLNNLQTHIARLLRQQETTNTTVFFVHWKRWLESQRGAQLRAAKLIQRYCGTYRSRKLTDALHSWGEATRRMAMVEERDDHNRAVHVVLLRFMVGGQVRFKTSWAFYHWLLKTKKTEVQTVTVRAHRYEDAAKCIGHAIQHTLRQHALKSTQMRFHTWRRVVQEEANRENLVTTVHSEVKMAQRAMEERHALQVMGHVFRKMVNTKLHWAWRAWTATGQGATSGDEVLILLERIQRLQKDLSETKSSAGERGAQIIARWARRMLTSKQHKAFLSWRQLLVQGHELTASSKVLTRLLIPFLRVSVKLRQTRAVMKWVNAVHRIGLKVFAADAAARAAAAAINGAAEAENIVMWAQEGARDDPLAGFLGRVMSSAGKKKHAKNPAALGVVNAMVMDVFEAMATKEAKKPHTLALKKTGAKKAVQAGALQTGGRVQVVKQGSQIGKTGVVTDADWAGRIKIQMDEDGTIKSYAPGEVEVFGKPAARPASGSSSSSSTSRIPPTARGPSMGLLQEKTRVTPALPNIREFIFSYYYSKFGKSRLSEQRVER
jgi:hypothetical protein